MRSPLTSKHMLQIATPPSATSHKTSNIRIAVVLPVFNTARYLPECIQSLLAQTHKNFKIFAVNDGSYDGSAETLNYYASKDDRLVVSHKKNGGVSSARNVALEQIETDGTFDLVCFVDSDDQVKPTFLADYASACVDHGADYVVCGWEYFDKAGPLHDCLRNATTPIKLIDMAGACHHAYKTAEWHDVRTCTTSCILANRCFSANAICGERFDTTMQKGEDQDFNNRALFHVTRGVVIEKINYMYRIRLSSLSHDNACIVDDMRLQMELIQKEALYPALVRVGLERCANDCWWEALKLAFSTGEYNKNKSLFVETYKILRTFNYHAPLPKKYKKRFFLFSLGDAVLWLYFISRKNKKATRGGGLENAFE